METHTKRLSPISDNIGFVSREMVKLSLARFFIYRLLDPDTLTTRYVGRCLDVQRRFKAHCGLQGDKTLAAYKWLAALRHTGKKPIVEVICDVIGKRKAVDTERREIEKAFREVGFALCNEKCTQISRRFVSLDSIWSYRDL